MKKYFHSFLIQGKVEEKNQPVLLICNHISWWDGIWTLYLNQQIFKRKYHFMMLEEQLRKNWFFNYTGGYSINPNSKTIIESINYTVELLGNKNNLVLMFPQGVIQSMHKRSFQFFKGIEKILQKAKNPAQVVFVANITDYLSEVKPTVFMNLEEYKGEYDLSSIEESYNRFYQSCIQAQNKIES
jgi:1-acyl-sn-glycerol-3-phosphate acyltransferase